MPLLDIATPQPSFRDHLCSVRFQRVRHVSCIFSNENARYVRVPGKASHITTSRSFETYRGGGLMIKAVATLEPRCFDNRNDSVRQLEIDSAASLPPAEDQSSSEESADLDEREKLRRMRISKANKGNTPWNKGRKHSPETVQRIRERTKIAMQDPKVKMKLVNLGHAQSNETKLKIGSGVRLGWEKRREKLMIQETCHFEWLNIIAEASRKGLYGEEELQWDSYAILDEQLEREWRESVEQRKRSKPKGSKRAPKSLEQRRKISEAIAAKWSDPMYRNRVYSGLSKYHGTTVGIAKPRRRRTKDKEPGNINPLNNSKELDGFSGSTMKSKSQKPKMKARKKPMYKDPQAGSKLEMIKSIRAQRAAADSPESEAIRKAKLLIAEAERASEALEVAATKSVVARESLNETRKLIAEATRYIDSIETGNIQSPETPTEPESETGFDTVLEGLTQLGRKGVNGVGALGLNEAEITEFGFSYMGDDGVPSTSSHEHVVVNGKEHIYVSGLPLEMNRCENEGGENSTEKTKSKRWVCGKLVEVDEDEDEEEDGRDLQLY